MKVENQLEERTKISQKVKQIENQKIDNNLAITEFYIELRKKINKVVDKSEKSMQVKLNQIYSQAIGTLTRANEMSQLSEIEIYQYLRKADRFMESLMVISLKQKLNKISDETKVLFENIKKIDLLMNAQKITDLDNLVSYQNYIKIENEPAKKLLYVNKKLMKIGQTFCSIQKSTLYKKIDMVTPIKLKNKEKNYILCLHEQMLAIYNDKLILQCHKDLSYNVQKLKGTSQVKNYFYIAEENKIMRINLHNMNQIMQKPISEQITAIANTQYNNSLIISSLNTLNFLTIDCELYYSMTNLNINHISSLKVNNQFLIAMGENSVRIYKGMTLHYRFRKFDVNPLQIIPLFSGGFILITKNSHFVLFQAIENGQTQHTFITSNLFTKNITSAAFTDKKICCLAQSGRKMHIYSY